jgi:hypothetical protein
VTPASGRALVTGASSGIGAAFARALWKRGHALVLVARRRERLLELQRELRGEEEAAVITADLARGDGASSVLRELEARGLEVDLLVNCAGVGHTARFCEQPLDRVLGMIELNVRALVELTRGLLPAMVARRRGAIVNVASSAAFQPVPYLGVYAATKSFVLSFTEALAHELEGSGVRVQALCPGITDTEFLEAAGTHAGVLAARLPRLTSEAVVEASLRGLEAGRLRVVPGFSNRVLAALVRFVPGTLTRAVAGRLYRP